MKRFTQKQKEEIVQRYLEVELTLLMAETKLTRFAYIDMFFIVLDSLVSFLQGC